ncbi:MAG: DUF11 domain-containing protein, partial [Sphingobacteriia bacterium]|nr:DUF11 domain-containing protein [Sphingobacteriia bacterium]
ELSYTARARAPGDGVTFVNTVTVTGSDQYDPNPDNDTATATVAPLVADLAITKTQVEAPATLGQDPGTLVAVDPSAIGAGETIYYLLKIENLGPDAALDVTVSDALPDGISNAERSFNVGNSWGPWTGSHPLTSLAAGATTYILIRGQVDAAQSEALVNVATVASAVTTDPNPANNEDTLSTPVGASADLELEKAELVAPLEIGGPIEYRLTVTNRGPAVASGVVIEDELDALIIDAEYSMDGGVTYVTPWSGSYAVGELAVGATFVLRIRGTLVDDRTNPEVIDNTATVTADTEDPNPDNNSDTTNTPIDVDADVRIEKSGPANVIAGEQILYSITVTNDGPAAALNVRINDSVASSVFDAVEVSDDGGASWSPWTGQYVVGDLDAGASRTIALRATVRANVAVGTVLTNTAVAVSDTPDTQPNNNTDSAQTTVDGSADVGVVKTLQSAPEAAVAGTQVEFLITYFNRGPSDATNFIVEDAVPAGLTDVEASFCNQAFVPWTTPRNVGTVVAGGECRIVIRGTLAAGVEGELTNTAVVSSDLSDPDTSNNEDSASVTVLTPALSLTKTATAINGGTPDPFVYTGVGDTISYTFEVTNTGNAPLSGVVVYDDTFGVEVGTAATLAVGETESFTYVHPVTAADLDAGSLVNTATARGTYGETEYDATDTATVAGEQAGALTLEKTATLVNGEAAEPGEALVFAAVGDEISYQYTLTNTGNVTLTALAVADDRTTVSCPAEPLAAGAEITCTATDVVTQEDLDAGAVTNVATASGVDPNAGAVTSEPATVTVEAAQGPELTLEKVLSDAPEPIALDSVLTYTVTATNTGNVTLTNVVVSDSLITPASETCASVAVGETCVLTGTYRVTQTDVDAGQVVNTAIADSDETVEIEDILKTELPSPEPPSAVNDQSLGNPIGSVVTLQVLDNDSAYPGLNLVPATVVLDGADAGSDGKTQTVPGEGVWTVDPVTGAITFTPESGFTGNPTPISYLVQDDQGNLSNAATVTVTYEIAVNIVRRCDNNTPYVDYAIESAAVGALDIQWYAVLASGERGAPIGDPLLDQPREGRLLWPGAEVDTTTGEVVTWPGWELIDGQWERTNPHAQDVNEIEFSINPTISVRVQYPDPEPSCRPYPPIPVAEDDVSLGHASGTLVVVDVLSNDLPVDSHPLVPATVSIEDADAGSDGLVKTVPGEGVWRVDVTTGAISFEPEPGFLGNPTPIQYRVEDDRGETSNLASVTVTYQEAAALRLEKVLLSASPDPIQVGSTLSYQITATNSGNVTLTGVEVGDPLLTPSSTTCASLLPGESCVLTGTAVVSLADVLAGEVVNQATAASAQTAPIMDELITPVPMPAVPLAADDASLGHPLGTVVTLDVLANDSANAGLALDPATVWIEGTAAPGQSLVVAGEGTWSLNPTTGAITFTPAPGFEGNPTPIGYSVQDTASQTSNVATVTVSYLGAPALSLAKTLYLGHDDGAGCASSEGSLALVSNEQIDQPLTWCFRVTNTGEHYLDRPVLVDAPLGIDMSDLTLLEGQLPLAPGASATWYYEELRNVSLINDATVTMTPTDAAGVPSGVPLVGGSDAGVIFGYLYDPPYGVKTGEMLEGQPVVNWNMVWVNDSPLPALGVVINDPIPEGMTYLGNLVCLPNGDTTVSECRYEAPTLEAPRGRVYVVADFAPDFGAVVGGPVEQAPRHELTISFDVTIDEPTVEQVFENQGVAEWDPDGDGPAVALSGATSDGLSGEDRPTVIVVPALDPALTLDKALIGAPSVIGVGQVLTYRLTATNTGGEVLSNVTITDDLPGLSSLSCVPAQPATLTPGATLICEASYVVTVADVLAGQVDNRATVSGSMPSGAEIVATADLTVAVGGKPTPTPSVTPAPTPTPAVTPTPAPTPSGSPTPTPSPIPTTASSALG